MSSKNPPRTGPIGRAAGSGPPNRFEKTHVEVDWEQLSADDEELAGPRKIATEFMTDRSQSILSENNSPDIPFRWSLNPYRGCEHGCSYCYARPYHEMLGFRAGLDFETKIMVKFDAVNLLRKALNKPTWRGELIALSGATDCYQPAERRFRLTRGLLEVMIQARQIVSIVTKNALLLRDLDLLRPLAEQHLVDVSVSLTTLDAQLARDLEPRTSTPAARLRAIEALRKSGVPVRAMVAPIIPGLNDHEIPEILSAACEAGAQSAAFTLLRLPLGVKPIFLDWLDQFRPLQREKVEGLLRETRDGHLNDSRFGHRMRGAGAYAEGIKNTFQMFTRKLGLDRPLPPLDGSQFRPPQEASGQKRLF